MSEAEKAAADQKEANEEAVIWPVLAHQWLKTVLG